MSIQVYHSPARPHGVPSARRKRHQTFLPVSQFGSSKERAGTMQRLPYCQECLKDALVVISSNLALLVE